VVARTRPNVTSYAHCLSCIFYVFQLVEDPVDSKHVAIIETNIFCNKESSYRLYKLNVLMYLSFESVFGVFV
jgi:hypothetical protein